MDKIFSGDESRELWEEINSINDTSHGSEIHNVLYSLVCHIQRLENKLDNQQLEKD